MAYKCRVCGMNDVDQPGGVCELCAIGQDPYASAMNGNAQADTRSFAPANNDMNGSYSTGKGRSRKVLIGGGSSVTNTDPYGNSLLPQNDEEDSVQVYHAGQVPLTQQNSSVVNTNSNNTTSNKTSASNQPATYGITKNIIVDNQKKSFLEKWFRSLFKGIPFTFDDDITMFQVFPDYTGSALNAMGNACDQVIIYGKVKAGTIAENNDVEVYGHRDSNNNIIAKTIKNKASGTTITPDKTIPAGVVWAITAILLLFVWATASGLGATGIVWVVVILLCLTNLPLVFKIIGVIFGFFFSIIKKMF